MHAGSSAPTPAAWARLTTLRHRRGFIKALAALCCVSQQAPAMWFNSLRKIPSRHVARVSAHTGIPVSELRPDLVAAPMPKGWVPAPLVALGKERRGYIMLAEALGLPPQSPWGWTRGKYQIPAEHAVAAAAFLGCDPAELRPDCFARAA